MSPVVGTLVDSSGRKPVLLFTTVALLMAHTVTALATNTFTIAMSKFVGSNVIGLFFLSAQTMLQDMHQSDPKKLASSTAAPGRVSAAVHDISQRSERASSSKPSKP